MSQIFEIPFSQPTFFAPLDHAFEDFDNETVSEWVFIENWMEGEAQLTIVVGSWVWATPPPVIRRNAIFARSAHDKDLQRSAARGWRDKQARKVIPLDEALARFEETQ